LRKFLSEEDLDDLWQNPDKGLYHMSTNVSSFYGRSIYNEALFNRYGEPSSRGDYLLKAQLMDYEATRSQFEAFAARKTDMRPATGLIYWMLNGAWPNLHWQLFDYYLAAAGSYYGTKVGARPEHVVYSYSERSLYLISHKLNSTGGRNVTLDLIDLNGTSLAHQEFGMEAFPNSAQYLGDVEGIENINDVALMKLVLTDGNSTTLSRNTYWLTATNDVLNWTNSSWYSTPVTQFADMSALFRMSNASVSVTTSEQRNPANISSLTVDMENRSEQPAFFVSLKLLDAGGAEVLPAFWSDNYVTLFPNETISADVSWGSEMEARSIVVTGVNVAPQTISLR
jgi:exo-1,4-beta-D-glucosaminidase